MSNVTPIQTSNTVKWASRDYMRLAIVGSTSFHNSGDYKRAAAVVSYLLGRLRPGVMISGGAPGVDAIAEWAAKLLHVPTDIRHPPFGAKTFEDFKPRNIEIASRCTHLVCIRDAEAQTYGSGWTRDYAADRLQKPTWSMELPGSVPPWPEWEEPC